jgi:hypothetical protein
MQGIAQRINAGHNRTDLAIGNRGRRYVGGGVDNGTHRIFPWRYCAHIRETGNETTMDNHLLDSSSYLLDDIIGHKVADFCPELQS